MLHAFFPFETHIAGNQNFTATDRLKYCITNWASTRKFSIPHFLSPFNILDKKTTQKCEQTQSSKRSFTERLLVLNRKWINWSSSTFVVSQHPVSHLTFYRRQPAQGTQIWLNTFWTSRFKQYKIHMYPLLLKHKLNPQRHFLSTFY